MMERKMLDLCYMSAIRAIRFIRHGKPYPRLMLQKPCLTAFMSLMRQVNAFSLLTEETAMQAARESEARWSKGEARGILDGIPVSVKDIVLSKDWPTQRGSKASPTDQSSYG